MKVFQASCIALALLLGPLTLGAFSAQGHEVACPLSEIQSAIDRPWKIAQYHVRFVEGEGGGFQALLPKKDGTFEVVGAATGEAAEALVAQRLDLLGMEPLDLKKLLLEHDQVMSELEPALHRIRDSEVGVSFKARLKDLFSLKNKFFIRTLNPGNKGPITLENLDDVAAGRFLAKDRAQLLRVVEKLKSLNGLEIVGEVEERSNLEGYRAYHITLKTPTGKLSEIQVMTRRTERWYDWDHDRVYKPLVPHEPRYKKILVEYGKQIARYLHRLDDNEPPGPLPDPTGIHVEDLFPQGDLK